MKLKKVNLKKYLIILVILLIPNFLRQIIYYVANLKYNSLDFIVSFETVAIHKMSFPWIGLLEELAIGIVFAYLWFQWKPLKFLSYGWITDALGDFISVLVWILVGVTPLQALGLSTILRFLFREVILFYGISGPLLNKYNIDLKKLSIGYTFIGIIVLLIVLL